MQRNARIRPLSKYHARHTPDPGRKVEGEAHLAVFLERMVHKGRRALVKSSHGRAVADGDGLWGGAQGASYPAGGV